MSDCFELRMGVYVKSECGRNRTGGGVGEGNELMWQTNARPQPIVQLSQPQNSCKVQSEDT